ncbi:M1 family metallopeptidase [Allokutzneria oryzae]|uniref:Aminopeptidase N n=1 Tax=Allokutzneria oryzae TaxID=1378989 RepID=A0ABV6A6L6_9PSEU
MTGRKADRRRPAATVASAVVTAALLLGADPAALAGPAATPGSPGLGDKLLPGLGNGGYDAQKYTVDYRFEPGVSTMDSRTTMVAVATQELSRFTMDFAGGTVSEVQVNGQRAPFAIEGEELVITPARPLRKGRSFTTEVRYVADRDAKVASPVDETAGWGRNSDGGFSFWSQPDRAHLFFPSNDHPSDKAQFVFRVDVPQGWNVVANGLLHSWTNNGGRDRFEYRTVHPITTQISQVAVGKLTTVPGTGPGGLPLRSAVPTDKAGAVRPALDKIPAHLAWLENKLGRRFPLETYGVLGVHGPSPVNTWALENATLSTFPVSSLLNAEEVEPVMVHEAAHQWFGNSVSFAGFSDVWLSEGFATYFDHLWTAETTKKPMGEMFRQAYERDQQIRDEAGSIVVSPIPEAIFGLARGGGSLVVYALRQQAGEQGFQRIMQAFLDRFRDRSATTEQFQRLVTEVGGPETGAVLDAWLHAKRTPPMPGHPDWKPGS